MRRRSRILLRDAAVTAVVVAVVAGLGLGGWRVTAYVRHHLGTSAHHSQGSAKGTQTKGTGSHEVASPERSPSHPSPPALGVYLGPGTLTATDSLDAQLNGRIGYALDFQPAPTWAALSDPSWLVHSWSSSPFTLVIAVPMLPDSGGTLAQGATGAYDSNFTLLAQRLVAGGLGGAVLMIGWQPESGQYPWRVSTPTQAADYVGFWDRIHEAMASVPGARFQFEWDVGRPSGGLTPAQLYPGDADVDIIGTDAFDVGAGVVGVAPQDQWTVLMSQPYGPSWAASFAASRGKRLALGMCGLAPVAAGGGGDNPSFVTQSVRWAQAAHVSLYMLWDDASWSITGGGFPQADAALAQAVGQGTLGTPGAGTT